MFQLVFFNRWLKFERELINVKSFQVFTYVSSRALASTEVASLGKTIFAETVSYRAANLENVSFRRKGLTLILQHFLASTRKNISKSLFLVFGIMYGFKSL